MSIATGPFKQLRYKKETTWGTLAGTSGGQILRRKVSGLDEVRNAFGSQEIRTDQQRGIYVHGTRRAEGSINGDLSGGTYKDLMQSLVRRDFTAVTAITGLSLTMAGSGPTYTVTRGSGSWLSDGVKVGMVVHITAGSVNANNLNKKLFVVTLTSTVMTVVPWGNGTMTAEGPIASCTVSVPGKITYVPASSHTNDSYTMEHWFSDISQSEVFAGCKIASADFNLPASGLIEATFGVMGRGFGQAPSGSAYFSSPTAATTSAGYTAVNGVLRAASAQLAVVTGLSIRVDGGMSVGEVLGSNYTPDVFPGPIIVNGQLTAYFDGATLRDAFYNETQISLHAVAYAGTTAAAECMAFTLPALKLSGAQKNDGTGPILLTCPFEAIVNASGGTGTDSEATSFWVQDSLA